MADHYDQDDSWDPSSFYALGALPFGFNGNFQALPTSRSFPVRTFLSLTDTSVNNSKILALIFCSMRALRVQSHQETNGRVAPGTRTIYRVQQEDAPHHAGVIGEDGILEECNRKSFGYTSTRLTRRIFTAEYMEYHTPPQSATDGSNASFESPST